MKSPIKKKLLHNPGESLDNEIEDIIYDMLLYLIPTLFVVILALLDWWRLYAKAPPTPLFSSVIALIMICITAWKVYNKLTIIKKIKLGRDGEKAVGQFLECLREKGARIFHDIPGDGFNLDHVVVHSTGVYVIETKTLSKPERGETKLVFDGRRILKNGLEIGRNPVIQVLAGSKWLAELIEQSTGQRFKIRPVVIYPGWYIQSTDEAKKSDVWVLNPKAFPSFISNSRETMNPEELNMFSKHLDMYIRATQDHNKTSHRT
jgi:hypothetical protein